MLATPISSNSIGEKRIIHQEIDKKSAIPNEIQNKVKLIDKNGNKIADNIEKMISGRFLVKFAKEVNVNLLKSFNLQIESVFNAFSTVIVDGRVKNLFDLAKSQEILIIEGIEKIKTHLAYSVPQMGVRTNIWDLGIEGDPSQSIAILDTGIDATHPMFKGKNIVWKDVAGVSSSVTGDEYLEPIDKNGHGTHVAGIAAGVGLDRPLQIVKGTIPQKGFFRIVESLPNIPAQTKIEYTIDWGNQGKDNPSTSIVVLVTTVDDINNAIAFSQTDTSGNYSDIITLDAGDYFLWVGSFSTSTGDPEGQKFEIITTIPDDMQLPKDTYRSYRGVAPDASIVSVKVFDDLGNGDSGTLIAGMDWVLNNKDTYNITVVNMSLGTDTISAIVDSAVADLANAGILVVSSAGNEGVNSGGIGSPGSAEMSLTVGAVNRVNEVAYYSSNGDPNVNTFVKPDILAPGGSVAIPALGDLSGYQEGNGLILSAASGETSWFTGQTLEGLQGTSMAAPHISGLAMLMYQKLKMQSSWTHSVEDVKKIKQAILSTAYEAGNIYNGGEQLQGGTKQNPPITPTTKDYVEGWGIVNAKMALDIISTVKQANQPIKADLSLENPYIQNSASIRVSLQTGQQYDFWATVPKGAKVDLLVISGTPTSTGDPQIVSHKFVDASAGNAVGNISILVNSTTEFIFSLKLRDSINNIDNVHLVVLSRDFIPSVTPILPEINGFVNLNDLPITFESVTNRVHATIDGNDLGIISSGYVVTGLGDGLHTISLEESNAITKQKDNKTFSFTIDTVLPSLTTNLTDMTVDQQFAISYTANDNSGIKSVRAMIGTSILAESTQGSGTLIIDPSIQPPGIYEFKVVAEDLAGNTVSDVATVTFANEIFITSNIEILEVQAFESVNIEWKAGADKPEKYRIFVDGNIAEENAWNGSNIVFSFTPTDLKTFNVTAQVLSTDGKSATNTIFITGIDKLAPIIDLSSNIELDATEIQEILFNVNEPFPYSIKVTYNDTVLAFLRPWNGSAFPIIVSGVPNTQAELKVDIVDTSENILNFSSTIIWKDLTAPKINEISDFQINIGEKRTVKWEWEEKFVQEVTIKKNGQLVYNTSSQVNSITLEIIEGTPGKYKYEIKIVDKGNNSAQADFIVNAIGPTTESITSVTQNAFLAYAKYWIFILPMLVVLRRKVKHGTKFQWFRQ